MYGNGPISIKTCVDAHVVDVYGLLRERVYVVWDCAGLDWTR